MTTSLSSIHGLTKKNMLSQLVTQQTDEATRLRFRDKVTTGLGATHGLNKFEKGTNINDLLESVSKFQFKEYFLDFDRLRKGFSSEARFRSALGMTNAEINEEDIQDLLKRYGMSDGQVNYKQFCEDVDRVFRKEKASIIKPTGAKKFSREESKLIFDTIKELRSVIKANRVLIKPSFADYDRTQTQRISVQQFARVLKQLNLMTSEDVFDLICQRYFDKGNTKEVNYVKFCHDVDRPEDMLEQLGLTDDHKKKVEIISPTDSIISKATKSNFFGDTTKGINVLENRFSKPTINLSNDPNDVEERIQTHVVMKRIRIGEFFRDYDKLRKGKVTANQFRMALSVLNFTMTEEEYDALTNKYATDDNMVNYSAFVESIDSAFTIKGIDKNPSLRVTQLDTQTVKLRSKKTLEYDEEDKSTMLELMEAYRNVIITRRLNLKPMFQDFDKTNSGHVTKSQFVRVLNGLNIDLPDDILSLVLKRYMDKGNVDDVNYFEFINDVDRPEDMFGAGRDFNHSYDYFSVTDAHKVGEQIIGLEPEDLDDVIARIRRNCSKSRLRLQEFFRDFDRLRSGNITKSQLRIGLSMAKIELSNSEFNLIAIQYVSSKPDMVRWRDLCDDIDQVFAPKGLEKDATVNYQAPATITKYGQKAAEKTDSNLAIKLVARFKIQLQRERLDAKSFFQSWDKHNRFKISPKQFRQVLAQFNFVVTDKEAAALSSHYTNEDGDVEYLKFLADANPEKENKVEETKSKYFSRGWKFDGIPDYEALMIKIKSIVKKGRIRLLEYFQDHDSLRKGYVPYMKFKGVLRGQNIELTEKEYDILIEKFKVNGDVKLIDYVLFEDEIDRIFTKKGLEKEPTARVDEFQPVNLIDPDDVLNDAEEDVLEECLVRIGTETRNRRLLLKPFFQDKDKIRCGVVANTRFRSIFDFLKLSLTEKEYGIINKRFVASAPNEINYLEFDNLLKKYSGDDQPF
jgi:Ca2+-binding EF-hand superfamily protein